MYLYTGVSGLSFLCLVLLAVGVVAPAVGIRPGDESDSHLGAMNKRDITRDADGVDGGDITSDAGEEGDDDSNDDNGDKDLDNVDDTDDEDDDDEDLELIGNRGVNPQPSGGQGGQRRGGRDDDSRDGSDSDRRGWGGEDDRRGGGGGGRGGGGGGGGWGGVRPAPPPPPRPAPAGRWTGWGHWSTCLCNQGYRYRYRTCLGICSGSALQTEYCTCSWDWTEWSSWSSCKTWSDCGWGTRDRTRKYCRAQYCIHTQTETVACYKTCPDYTRPSSSCGVRPSTHDALHSILGGQAATPGSWPWVVGIFYKGHGDQQYMCGGTIINRKWILTAAHCIKSKHRTYGADNLVVRIGAHDWRTSRGAEHSVAATHVYPLYNPNTYPHDIALLKLQHDTDATPACLPSSNTPINQVCTAAGWGKQSTTDTSGHSDVLHEVNLHVRQDSDCTRGYGAYYKPGGMLCVGYYPQTQGTLRGDSGSPLNCVSRTSSRYYVAGVTSFSIQGRTFPDVYTNVFHYKNWIEHKMKYA